MSLARPGNPDPATGYERFIYWGLVLLLFLAPLPFGSIRRWAVAAIVIWVAVLCALWALGWAAGRCVVRPSFQHGRLALGLLGLWAGLLTLQITPLAAGFAEWLSPGAAAVHASQHLYSSAGPSGWPHSITLSIDVAATRRQHLLTLALTGYFALLLLVIAHTNRLKHFTLMMVTSGIVWSVVAVYLHFTGASYQLFHETVVHEMTMGPFLNRNHFATYIEICLACGVGLVVAEFSPAQLTTGKQRLRWVLALLLSTKARMRLMLIVMVIALILTRSRMGNAAFFTALIAGGCVALLFMHAGWKTLVVFLTSMLILDAAVIGSWIGLDQVIKRVQQTPLAAVAAVDGKRPADKGEESVEERTDQGLSALASVAAFPWFGTGAGSFEAMYPQHKPPGYPFTLNHAHNDYIQFIVEGGVLGATLLFGLIVLAYRAVLQTMRNSASTTRRGLALGAFIGMLSSMIHASVEFALQTPAIMLLFTALLAVALLTQDRHPRARSAPADPATP